MPFFAARPEKRLKPLMPERFDHDGLLTVKHRLSIWVDMEKPGQCTLERWIGYLDIVSDPVAVAQLAKDTGLGRESLYKALSGEENPSFATILKVTRALALRLHATHAKEAA